MPQKSTVRERRNQKCSRKLNSLIANNSQPEKEEKQQKSQDKKKLKAEAKRLKKKEKKLLQIAEEIQTKDRAVSNDYTSDEICQITTLLKQHPQVANEVTKLIQSHSLNDILSKISDQSVLRPYKMNGKRKKQRAIEKSVFLAICPLSEEVIQVLEPVVALSANNSSYYRKAKLSLLFESTFAN